MILVSLRNDITLIEDKNEFVLQNSQRRLTFRQPKTGLQRAVRILAGNGLTRAALNQAVAEDGGAALMRFFGYWNKLVQLGWIDHAVWEGERCLTTAVSMVNTDYRFALPELDAVPYALSHFSYFHSVAGAMVLESPLSLTRVTFQDGNAAALALQLATPQQVDGLSSPLWAQTRSELIQLLLAAKMVYPADALPEQQNVALRQWEFHDLLFHSRSRAGRQDGFVGATYRFAGDISPLPAVRPRFESIEVVSLPKPDLAYLKQEDVGFTHVLEARRSIRDEEPQAPLTVAQLGEFLYRSARIKSLFEGEYQELSKRPYPGGGAIYELEIYLVVSQCEGSVAGLYHYRPFEHELEFLAAQTEQMQQFYWQYQPPVQFIFASRHQRLSWKYSSIAYSVTLKNVGVLQQTMYLVATAMGLAPSALGGGDSDLFARVSGLDYFEETAVGEFGLGGAVNND
ncbi:MAG: SagB family peptide dehydrogenase [Chloroflexota bacterium]